MAEELPEPDAESTGDELKLYLAACFCEDKGDGRTIKAALDRIARAHGYSALAQATGMTRAGLYRALSPEGDPKLSTVLRIMKAMQLTK